ncbi:MAG: hypothetical protein RI101_02005 [Nitrospira sp.]|jgi:hypothetical protein|nr:hypothetical protein [Nitrospira sp.]
MTVQFAESAPAISGLPSNAGRIDYIDVSRGVLVLLMFVVHAATPCTPSIRDPIQRLWILEIATTGFAMMAGYTIGVRYDANAGLPQPRRLWKRSGELLLVMFWSNLLLGLGKLYVTQKPDFAMLASWFLGLITLHTEYNISGVLFPIALVLPLLPLMYSSEQRIGKLGGLVWFAAIVSLTMILKQFTVEIPAIEHVRNILLVGLGGFSVLGFIAYGVLGYVNARILHACQRMGWSWGTVVSAGIILSSGLLAVMGSVAMEGALWSGVSQWQHALLPFVRSEVMFLGVIAFGGLITAWWSERFMVEPLRLLGTYALCAFVFHRFVGQGLVTAFPLHGGGLGTFLFMLAVISGCTYLLIVARQSIASVDTGLRRLFL